MQQPPDKTAPKRFDFEWPKLPSAVRLRRLQMRTLQSRRSGVTAPALVAAIATEERHPSPNKIIYAGKTAHV